MGNCYRIIFGIISGIFQSRIILFELINWQI